MFGVLDAAICVHPTSCGADFVLGVRLLMSACKGNCGYKGTSNCSVQVLLGSLITSAAVIDSALAIVFVHCMQHICLQLDAINRKVRHSVAA
jgi:hypothetical protein